MSNDELLEKIKIALSADDSDDNNGTLMIKLISIKQYMLNSGVSEEQIETDLGVATLAMGVNDIWNVAPGDLKFSTLFIDFVTQLAVKSLPITE